MFYYIPIHIDNVDNVVSAEGLSPADDYALRGYGYSRFKTLKDIPSKKVVCLFDHIPHIADDTVEKEQICYIEIDGKYINTEVDVVYFDGGVAIAGAIDLLPWNCRFLFPTEETIYQAVIVCRSSLCNKMWEYFRFSLMDRYPEPYKEIVVPEIWNCDKDITAAVKINRLKGFLFLYTLGRYVSMPQALANMLQIEKKIYDVATTIAGLQSYKKEGFLKQLDDLEGKFEKYDPVRDEVQKHWTAMIENCFSGKENQLAFESIVRELGVEDLMKSNFAKKNGYIVRSRAQMSLARPSDWEYYKKSIEDYTQSQIRSYRERFGDTNTTEDFRIEKTRVVMSPKYGSSYSRIITSIIDGLDWFNLENLRLHRLDFASELTRMVRDQIIESGQTWEGSLARVFLNDLRQHIALGGPFDISKAPDITLKSLAIFVLKGDDWEEMLRYMENNAQVDYRFVLGLWGVCVGYADIPKTIIQRMKLDSQSVSRIYLSAIRNIAEVPEGYSMELQSYQDARTAQLDAETEGLDRVLNDKSLGLTKIQKDALRELWEASKGCANGAFYDKLAHVKGIGRVRIQRIREMLSQKDSSFEEEQLDLFGNRQDGTPPKFDMTAWQYIDPLLPDDNIIKSKVKNDLRMYLSRRRRTETNSSLISNYKAHLQQMAFPNNPRYSWAAGYFGSLDINGIIKQLENIYL